MSRAFLSETILNQYGSVIVGASVRVEDPSTSNLLSDTLYAAATGSATLVNPLTSDDSGQIAFYEPGTVRETRTLSNSVPV